MDEIVPESIKTNQVLSFMNAKLNEKELKISHLFVTES
jgi:hypothetical protein